MSEEMSTELKSMELPEERMFQLDQRKAVALSKADVLPDMYKGNIANCLIALETAQKLNLPPLTVMQNMYIVYGKPSWSSQFLAAAMNSSGRFTCIKYRFFGDEGTDSYGCYAHVVERETGELIQGPKVTIGMARKEGWYDKKGSKWQTMPELMLRYRAATFLVRTTAPELTLGYAVGDEVEDVGLPQPKITTFDALTGEIDADPLGG